MSKTIEVLDETYNKIKDQLTKEEAVAINDMKDMVGKKFFFRTVTYHHVGRVVKQIGDFIQLEDSSWVADSGRFMQALKNGSLEEVEPVGTFYINTKAVVDFAPWVHDLPKEQK